MRKSWKKAVSIGCATCLLVSTVPMMGDMMSVQAAENSVEAQSEEEMSGTWGTCEWEYQDGVLTIGEGIATDSGYPWSKFKSELTKLVFTGEVHFESQNISFKGLFRFFQNLEEIEGLEYLDTSNVTDMSYMFSECIKLKKMNVGHFDTSRVENMKSMFSSCMELEEADVSSFDTSNVTNMSNMFTSCYKLKKVDAGSFDTSKVTDMTWIFARCKSLEEVNVSSFDTSQLISTGEMFSECESLKKLDVSNFDTSQVQYMGFMFYNCKSLEELDVSNFDTSQVTGVGMMHMFVGCSSLKSLDVSNFDTSKLQSLPVFSDCSSLEELDVSNFDTSMATSTSGMFQNCSSLHELDLGNFDLSNVTSVYGMFGEMSLSMIVIPKEVNETIKNEMWRDIINAMQSGIWKDETEGTVYEGIPNASDLQKGHKYINTSANMTREDKDTGIVIKNEDGTAFDKKVVLVAGDVSNDEEYEEYKNIAEELGESYYLYNIYMEKSGEVIQPDGKVQVSIPLSEDMKKSARVYNIAEDGTVTDMNAEYADGNLVFVTDHFSVYAVVNNNVQFGDVNEDGEITMQDSALLRRYLAGWDVTFNEAAADVNGDGMITMADSALLRRYLAGWDVTLG